jgi:hypothetical protein
VVPDGIGKKVVGIDKKGQFVELFPQRYVNVTESLTKNLLFIPDLVF